MAQTREGAIKVAAKRLGISFDEYLARVNAGLKWCSVGKHWQPITNFWVDKNRKDGLNSGCIDCRTVDDPQHWLRGKEMPEEVKKKISGTLKERYKNQPHHLRGYPSKRKGKKRSLATRKKISQTVRRNAARGKDAPGYIDGKGAERRGLRATDKYKRWRYDVYMRDRFTCQKCGDDRGGNLHAHHIKPFAKYPELHLEVSNGITLCESCHAEEHR